MKRNRRYPYRQTVVIDNKIHDVKAKTQEELESKVELLKQKYGVKDKPTITVSQWIPEALRLYKPNITKSALAGYTSKCNRHIVPIIGEYSLTEITPLQCQAVIASLSQYATDTQRKVKQLLIFIFSSAVRAGYIDTNPALNVTDPQSKPPQKRRTLTQKERQSIIDTIPEDPRYIIYGLMLYCGCRPSEAAGVTYEDISDGVLHIRGTKTANADRYVPIPDLLQSMIPPQSESDYIATDNYGHMLSASSRRRLWIKFSTAANLPEDVVPYCLRHTYCTDLMEAGVDIRVTSRLMGHASIAITNDIYTHIQDNDIAEAKTKIDAFSRK